MSRPITESVWHQLTTAITQTMGAWRLAHPTASLREIETELDARLAHMRARMLEDLALTSATAAWNTTPTPPPRCPQCHEPLVERGAKTRTLQTHGGQDLCLTRSYGVCPACGVGVFPPR